jgi:hypothetical protein
LIRYTVPRLKPVSAATVPTLTSFESSWRAVSYCFLV